MKNKVCLTASDAHTIVATCKTVAERKQWSVTIAVVDEAGYLLHLERMDAAVLQSPEIAILKARTAALSRLPTKSLEDIVRERPATVIFPGRLPVQGGLPIIHDGECIGGVGVSGVKSYEDETIARAGIDAWSANPPDTRARAFLQP